MTVTLDEAVDQLNLVDDEDLFEVQLFVDAANEWVDGRIGKPGWIDSSKPHSARLATLMLIDHLWQTQRGPDSGTLVGDEIVTVSGTGFAVPNRVVELLQDPSTATAAPSHSFPSSFAWPDAVEIPAPVSRR